MMLPQLKFILYLLIAPITATFYKNNITDFSKCQIYYSRSGKEYKDFFKIVDHMKNGSILDFHFSVISPSDAHILLAPSSMVEAEDPVYEIVIGAGGNTFSDIRRKQKSNVRATVHNRGLLSSLDPHSFWIHISNDGVIEIGKEGEELAFLSWKDPDPLPLKVFSFSTWPGIEAKWYFNCPRGNDTSQSEEVGRPKTPLEQLRFNLLFQYDPYVKPVYNLSTITVVGLTIITKFVNLDEYRGILQYQGVLTMTWQDEKLHWNPSNYSGISTLHIFRREIWIPDLYLEYTADMDNQFLEDTLLVVNSTGHVTWTTNFNMNTWCNPQDMGRWPRDEHTCEVILAFFSHYDTTRLIFNANASKFEGVYSTRWVILSAEHFANLGNNSTVEDAFDPPLLTIRMKLGRVSKFYHLVFFSPFIVVSVSLLVTFWTSPFDYLKISLPCFSLVLSSIILVVLGFVMPIQSRLIPNLVLLYSYSLVAIMICIVIETIIINLSRNQHKYPVPHFMAKIILSSYVQFCLILPSMNVFKRDGTSCESQQLVWILLAVALDRIIFFVYLGLSVYAVSAVTY